MNKTNEKYWKKRSFKYNNLKWVYNDSYMYNLCKAANFNKKQIVMDMGSGTGAVSKNIKNLVKKVIALDISSDMLNKGNCNNISFIKWDIRNSLFKDNIFDRIVARMVFHHILKKQDKAIQNCYKYLKKSGKIIIAEAIPPSNSDNVINWFYDMFDYKEERVRIFPSDFKLKLQNNGFEDIKIFKHWMFDFDINNWIENSGLSKNKISKIIQMHIEAPSDVKNAYNMKINNGKITINSKYMIMTGNK